MNRRHFIERLFAAFAFLSVGSPELKATDLVPSGIRLTDLERFMLADVDRMRASILKCLMSPSPLLAMIDDQPITSMPKVCTIWKERYEEGKRVSGGPCGGKIVRNGSKRGYNFMECDRCGASYGSPTKPK